MSTHEQHGPHSTEAEAHHAPYMKVFVWLTVLTIIEVFPILTEELLGIIVVPHVYYIPVLLTVALIKAAMVAWYYMHLRDEPLWLTALILSPFFFAMYFGLVVVVRYVTSA